LQKALEIFKAVKSRRNEAEVLKNLAELHHKTNQVKQAREYCKAALQIAKELGIPLVK
jgi:tetratricopeptide (TPR) repeat protein